MPRPGARASPTPRQPRPPATLTSGIRPLPVEIGRYRYRSPAEFLFVARRAAEDLSPFRAKIERAVRDMALGRDSHQPG